MEIKHILKENNLSEINILEYDINIFQLINENYIVLSENSNIFLNNDSFTKKKRNIGLIKNRTLTKKRRGLRHDKKRFPRDRKQIINHVTRHLKDDRF